MMGFADLSDEEFIKLVREGIESGARTLGVMRMLGILHTKNTPVGELLPSSVTCQSHLCLDGACYAL